MAKKPIEWTGAHRREAKARLCEVAAMLARADVAKYAVEGTSNGGSAQEDMFRRALRYAASYGADIDVAREVRRVDGLATGRLVRVVTWRGESGEEWVTREEALADKSHGGGRLARVTRIMRAP